MQRVVPELRDAADMVLGSRLGPAPTQQQLDNIYIMVIYSPQYYPYYRLLLGGGRTQGLGFRV